MAHCFLLVLSARALGADLAGTLAAASPALLCRRTWSPR